MSKPDLEPDWNLRLLFVREALDRLPVEDGHVDWGDVRVGHIDTGCTRHPVFGDWAAGRQWILLDEGRNLLEPGRPPLDPLNYQGNPGHGTRTGSILCGFAPEGASLTPIGVAPRLPVVPYRVVESVVLLHVRQRAALAEAIRHAVDVAGCQVISISLGFPVLVGDGGLGEAVDHAYERGVIVVAAGGQVIDSVCYPAKYDRTIGVGGVKPDRSLWFRYGQGAEMIDVWAPASEVPRADGFPEPGQVPAQPTEPEDPGSSGSSVGSVGSNSGSFGKGAGTSFATVHVAAAAAMWLRLRGDELRATYPEGWMRVEAFRRQVRQAHTGVNGPPTANGTGIIDIPRVLLKGLPQPGDLRKAPEDKDKIA